ncbi:MAG TPA: EVE domain-containing protein [Flavobacteriales bacterium]|nr:EVE domain-containing protein [Flavobacteriales bacterium]HRE97425.1 EVE domain-containing protein [Flavobacteriales bacterium]HRJ35303.1 EVE domain-containing protein [Flavobacteriales bacterium]HRJ38916.1 EVE domain-containing protein [Flavobacteriales bacterium]
MNYWLLKSEPDVFSWDDLVKKGPSVWDGVRNYQARNNLKAMKKGDKALFYHSNIGREIVGIATITKPFFPDPTIDDERWVAVEVKAQKKFKNAVTLDTIKNTPALAKLPLVTHSRLSVMPVSELDFVLLCDMGGIVS